MAVITTNRTRYNTDDLLALLEWFENELALRELLRAPGDVSSWQERVKQEGWRPPKSISIATASPGAVTDGRSVQFRLERGYGGGDKITPSSWGEGGNTWVLKLLAPRNLEEGDLGRVAAHAWKDERPVLPLEAARDILRWYFSCGVMSPPSIQANQKTVVNFIANAVGAAPCSLPPVYVEKKVRDPHLAADKSVEAKIRRCRGKFGDSTRSMDGSSTTPAYHWEKGIRWAREYYVREWTRREKWRMKILALGEECEAHMTFEEYLLYCVERLQTRGQLP